MTNLTTLTKTLLIMVCLGSASAAFLDFHLVNNLDKKVLVFILATQDITPFEINAKSSKVVMLLTPFSGRFAAQTDCNPASDCDNFNPSTWIDVAVTGDLAFYDVTLEYGFNLPISIEPLNATAVGASKCAQISCKADILSTCPEELRLKNRAGAVIACRSACQVFKTDEYCCRGPYATAEKCQPSSWKVNYPAFFKEKCPNALSYIFDRQRTPISCDSKKYLIAFG